MRWFAIRQCICNEHWMLSIQYEKQHHMTPTIVPFYICNPQQNVVCSLRGYKVCKLGARAHVYSTYNHKSNSRNYANTFGLAMNVQNVWMRVKISVSICLRERSTFNSCYSKSATLSGSPAFVLFPKSSHSKKDTFNASNKSLKQVYHMKWYDARCLIIDSSHK